MPNSFHSVTRRTLVLVGALATPSACGYTAIDWRNHASFQSKGKDLVSAVVAGDGSEASKVRAGKDFVTLSIDRVFFRNLPELGAGSVALGVSIDGVRSDGKSLKTVAGLTEGVGANAFLSFDNVLVIEPFRYSGANVTITLHFSPIPDRSFPAIRSAIDSLGIVLKRIDPAGTAALGGPSESFKNIVEAFHCFIPQVWKYSFTLFSAKATFRDRPDLVFSEGRFVIVANRPARASSVDRLVMSKLVKRLRLERNRLVDTVSGEEFTDRPYVVITVTRVPKS